MSETVLLVFEGAAKEKQIFERIKRHFFQDTSFIFIPVSYDTLIYELYKEIRDDEDMDLVEILRDKNDKNKRLLESVKRKQIAQIFMFFDYDGHDNRADDETLKEMLELFCEETEHGKLFISYPMVESITDFPKEPDGCHLSDECAIRCNVKAKDKIACDDSGIKYKELVSTTSSLPNVKNLNESHWNFILLHTLKKANCLLNESYSKPEYSVLGSFDQLSIFLKQLEKYIIPNGTVNVINGFPFFIIGQFGEDFYNSIKI